MCQAMAGVHSFMATERSCTGEMRVSPHKGTWSDPSSAAEDNDDNDDTQNNFEADAQFHIQAVTRNVSPKIINSG